MSYPPCWEVPEAWLVGVVLAASRTLSACVPWQNRRMRVFSFLLVLAAALPADAADLYVAVGGADTPTCPVTSPCATVSYALTQAAFGGGDTIHLGDGTFDGDLVIDRPVVLDGSGRSIVAGSGTDVVLSWSGSADLTLRRMEIRNGGAGAVHSGGLAVVGGNVLIEDCVFTANVAGNAITQDGGSLTIRRTTISDNGTATMPGGGIRAEHGSLVVEDSTIERNTGLQNGVGIRVGSGEDARLLRTTVRSNVGASDRPGGGILVAGTATIADCDISDNDPVGLVVSSVTGERGRATVDRCTIARNRGSAGGIFSIGGGDLVLRDSLVMDNMSRGNGAGIDWCGSALIERCAIVGNVTSGALTDGGGIKVANCGATINTQADVTIVNCTISGNTAVRYGGGVAAAGTMTRIFSSTIAFNSAGDSGGGVNQRGASRTLEMSGCIVAGNSAPAGCPNVGGTWVSRGHNLLDDATGSTPTGDTTTDLLDVDPLLEPLRDNGGPTPTHALRACSPAIDTGDGLAPGSGVITDDQRGVARPTDGDCDGGTAFDRGALEWIACGGCLTLYESPVPDGVVQPSHAVASPPGAPFAYAAPAAPVLFYQLDDGSGSPALIFVTESAGGLSFDW